MFKSINERFEEKIERITESGCWIWMASLNNGYGQFSYNGVMRLAHRVSWEIHIGLIPKGLCALHRCDNPLCTNPSHLFLGTIDDNNKDCANKGRQINQNTKKTHCKNGHPFSGENLSIKLSGARVCKTCAREWMRKKRGGK